MQDGLGDCARPGSPRSSTHPDPVLGDRVAPRAMSMAGPDAAAAGLIEACAGCAWWPLRHRSDSPPERRTTSVGIGRRNTSRRIKPPDAAMPAGRPTRPMCRFGLGLPRRAVRLAR